MTAFSTMSQKNLAMSPSVRLCVEQSIYPKRLASCQAAGPTLSSARSVCPGGGGAPKEPSAAAGWRAAGWRRSSSPRAGLPSVPPRGLKLLEAQSAGGYRPGVGGAGAARRRPIAGGRGGAPKRGKKKVRRKVRGSLREDWPDRGPGAGLWPSAPKIRCWAILHSFPPPSPRPLFLPKKVSLVR